MWPRWDSNLQSLHLLSDSLPTAYGAGLCFDFEKESTLKEKNLLPATLKEKSLLPAGAFFPF